MKHLDKNTAAVVITYNPSIDVAVNIEWMANHVHHVVVVDNTPRASQFNKPIKASNVTILFNRKNTGLAKALNDGIAQAARLGCTLFFLFDQDSRPYDDFFDSMLRFKRCIDAKTSRCALYVPNFYDRNSRSWARFPLLTPYTFKHLSCIEAKPYYASKALIAITSGTLLSYERFMRIGPFSEDYFIDFLDNEYCLRVARLGLLVAVNCDAVINHAIGKRSIKRLLFLRIKPNNHQPVRRYYIARNGVQTALNYYPYFKSFLLLLFLRLLHEGLSIVLFENFKNRKIKALFVGILDGLRGKMGSCEHIYFDISD